MRTMTYHPGDCVYPADLPRRFLCRVAQAERVRIHAGSFQILTLEPLEGPWRPGTVLVREEGTVRAARPPRALRHLAAHRVGADISRAGGGEAA